MYVDSLTSFSIVFWVLVIHPLKIQFISFDCVNKYIVAKYFWKYLTQIIDANNKQHPIQFSVFLFLIIKIIMTENFSNN